MSQNFKLFEIKKSKINELVEKLDKIELLNEDTEIIKDRPHKLKYKGGKFNFKGKEIEVVIYNTKKESSNDLNNNWIIKDKFWYESPDQNKKKSKDLKESYEKKINVLFENNEINKMNYFVSITFWKNKKIDRMFIFDFYGNNSDFFKDNHKDPYFCNNFINKISEIDVTSQLIISPSSQKPKKRESYKNSVKNQIKSLGGMTKEINIKITSEEFSELNMSENLKIRNSISWSMNGNPDPDKIFNLLLKIIEISELKDEREITIFVPEPDEMQRELTKDFIKKIADLEGWEEFSKQASFNIDEIEDSLSNKKLSIKLGIPKVVKVDRHFIGENDYSFTFEGIFDIIKKLKKIMQLLEDVPDGENKLTELLNSKFIQITKIKIEEEKEKTLNLFKILDVWDWKYKENKYFLMEGSWHEVDENIIEEIIKIIEKYSEGEEPRINHYKKNSLPHYKNGIKEDEFNKMCTAIINKKENDKAILLDKTLMPTKLGLFELADIVTYSKEKKLIEFHAVKRNDYLSQTTRVFEQGIMAINNLRSLDKYKKLLIDYFVKEQDKENVNFKYVLDIYHNQKKQEILKVKSHYFKTIAVNFIQEAVNYGFDPIININNFSEKDYEDYDKNMKEAEKASKRFTTKGTEEFILLQGLKKIV